MRHRDWRSLVDSTIDTHLAALRSAVSEEERTRRERAHDELNALAMWTARSSVEIATGARTGLEKAAPTDAPWVALAKHHLRRGCEFEAARGGLAGFARALDGRKRAWHEQARELLGGEPVDASPGPASFAKSSTRTSSSTTTTSAPKVAPAAPPAAAKATAAAPEEARVLPPAAPSLATAPERSIAADPAPRPPVKEPPSGEPPVKEPPYDPESKKAPVREPQPSDPADRKAPVREPEKPAAARGTGAPAKKGKKGR